MTPAEFAKASDARDVIFEFLAGYKSKAKESGFSDEASEAMAVQMHAKIMNT